MSSSDRHQHVDWKTHGVKVIPGDQLDRTINFTQNTAINGAGSTLTGTNRPIFQTNTSDFWVQGITIGLELRY